MKRALVPSAAVVLALSVTVGVVAGGTGSARSAQQEPAEPAVGRGEHGSERLEECRCDERSELRLDAGAPRIQLEIDVTASGGGEGTGENERSTWHITSRVPSRGRRGLGPISTKAIELTATASPSSNGEIVLSFLSVEAHDPVTSLPVVDSRFEGLVLRDGERTVILKTTDPAHGSVTIAVTATALDEPAGPRAAE